MVGQTTSYDVRRSKSLSTEAEISLLFMVPFDYPLFVEDEILGSEEAITLGSCQGRLEFPKEAEPSKGSRALLPPTSAGESIGAHFEDRWGIQPESGQPIEINAILVAVPVRAELSFNLLGNQVGGEGVHAVLEEVSAWFESFCHWLWVLTAQALDPSNPDPKVLHRRSSNIIFAAFSSGRFSLPASGSPRLTSRLDGHGPTSERLMDRRVLALCVSRAGTPRPPITWELLASARMAGRRGDARRALIDAGTAAEGALTKVLSLPPTHKYTLQGLVTMALKRKIGVPSDAHAALVQPRNDAVHRGYLSGINIDRGIEIAEDLIVLADPDFIRGSSLRPVNRPQRHDIVIIQPGASNSSSNKEP
jgi:hypothetical protein